MSASNGTHQFLYVVMIKRGGEIITYLLRSDHDPDQDEIAKTFDIALAPADEIKAARYEYDSLPVVPPKGKTK